MSLINILIRGFVLDSHAVPTVSDTIVLRDTINRVADQHTVQQMYSSGSGYDHSYPGGTPIGMVPPAGAYGPGQGYEGGPG